jgi:RNA polymerase sigma factor (sigma-70 family)
MSRSSFIATRRSLLSRLRNVEDQGSWTEFFQTYWRLLYSVALKAGLSDADAQEVVQETVISVSRTMPGFRYDPALGSFKSWLLNITRRRIADQFRKKGREWRAREELPEFSTGTAPLERVADPGSGDWDKVWEAEWKAHILELALDGVRSRVSPRQFQLFELYTVKNWPVERIQQTLGVSAGQVYLAKVRVGKLLKEAVKKLEERGA